MAIPILLLNDNMLFKAEHKVNTEMNSMTRSLNGFRLLQIIINAVIGFFMTCDGDEFLYSILAIKKEEIF